MSQVSSNQLPSFFCWVLCLILLLIFYFSFQSHHAYCPGGSPKACRCVCVWLYKHAHMCVFWCIPEQHAHPTVNAE